MKKTPFSDFRGHAKCLWKYPFLRDFKNADACQYGQTVGVPGVGIMINNRDIASLPNQPQTTLV